MKYILIFALLFIFSFSYGQYYGQLIQTPTLLHPLYAAQDTLSAGIASQYLEKIKRRGYEGSHYNSAEYNKNILLTVNGLFTNRRWNWGTTVYYENSRGNSDNFFRSLFTGINNQNRTAGTRNKTALSLFSGYVLNKNRSRYYWLTSFGLDFVHTASNSHSEGSFSNTVSGSPDLVNTSYTSRETSMHYSPLAWAGIAFRSQRISLGAKVGGGKSFIIRSLEQNSYSDHAGQNDQYRAERQLNHHYVSVSVTAEARFPKNPDAFFSFRPIVALEENFHFNRNYYSTYNYHAVPFSIHHVSANFRLGKIPFGAGITNENINLYAGYTFRKMSVTGGLGVKNYSLALRCNL